VTQDITNGIADLCKRLGGSLIMAVSTYHHSMIQQICSLLCTVSEMYSQILVETRGHLDVAPHIHL